MAWVWEMAVGTESKEAADHFAASFDRSTVRIEGHDIWFRIWVERLDGTMQWGVTIMPYYAPEPHGEGVATRGGAESEEHAKLITAIGNTLYERLLQAAPFQIALVGVECSGFYGFEDHDDLVQDLAAGDDRIDGLVISAALWEAAGQPKAFVARPDGTYWIPWRGEPFED